MSKKHGLSHKRGYQSWDSMKRRCLHPTHKDFAHYGARGITICPSWSTYEGFFADMGEAPAGTSLDRIDNDKGYYKENCRWADKSTQTLNRRILKRNASGCSGVSWQMKSQKWLASLMQKGVRTTLYWGTDFFEACCAVKRVRK